MRTLIATGEVQNASPFLLGLCDLDFELLKGFSVTRDDISELQFRGLRILDDEKGKMSERAGNMESAKQAASGRKFEF